MATKVKLIADNAITTTQIDTSSLDSHFSGGTGVTYSSGEISIGQAVHSTDSPTFADLTLTGNLNITGDLNSYSVTDLDVTDQTITLGTGQTEALSGGSGIIVDGSNASILWDETNDVFDINKGLTALGNVGIGTTSPQQDLHISSSEAVIRLEDAAGYTDIKSLNNSGINIDCDGGNTDPDTEFRVSIDGSQKFVIDTSGNVGIGTTSPQNPLHVASGSPSIRIEDTDGGYGLVSGLNGNVRLRADEGNTEANSFVGFEVDSSEYMRIDSSGNVGIGTSSPAVLLDVSASTVSPSYNYASRMVGNFERSGNATIAIRTDSSSTSSVDFADENDADVGRVTYDHSNNTMRFFTLSSVNTSAALAIDSSSRVGIGTDSPTERLQVIQNSGNDRSIIVAESTVGGSAEAGIAVRNTAGEGRFAIGGADHAFIENATQGKDLYFATYPTGGSESTEAMRITHDGKVGIGTATPEVGFHYAGSQALFEYTTDGGNESFLKIRSQYDRDVGIAIENNVTSQAWKIFIDGGATGSAGGDDSLIFHNTGGFQVLSLDQNGYVHIGTSASADRPLHVFASGEASAIKLTRSDSSKSVELGQGSSFAFLQALNSGGLGIGSSNSNEDLFINNDGNLFLQGEDSNNETRLVLDGSGGELATTGLLIRTGNNGATDHAGGFIELPNANAEFGIKVNSILSNYTPDGQRYMWGATTVDTHLARTPTRGYFDGGTSMAAGEVVVAIVSNDSTSADNHLLELCYAGDDSFSVTEYIFFTDENGTNGTITSGGNGSVAYNTTSDSRLKENVVDASAALSKIQNVEVKEFNFINYPHVTHTGMLAQDLNEIIPEAVKVGGEDAAKDPWSVDYSKLVPFLIKGMQEQQTIIDDLKARIETLEG